MSRPVRRRAGAFRGPVVFAFVLAGLLAVVAVASRGTFVGGEAKDADLPPTLFSYLYAAFLVAAVSALPLLVYLYARERPETPAARRKRHMLPILIVIGGGILLAVAARWPDRFEAAVDRIRIFGDGDPETASRQRGTPPAPDWVPLVVVASLAVGAAMLYVAWRRLRPARRRGDRLAAALSETLEGTLDDLRSETDARRAIILAYARLERTLERCGVARHEAEAPLEYLARVLLELEVTPAPVEALTDLFEQAKFSRHEMDGAMKDDAIAALEAVRDELRAVA